MGGVGMHPSWQQETRRKHTVHPVGRSVSAPKETELEEVKGGRGLGAVILKRVTREGLPEKGTSELKGVTEGREPGGHFGKGLPRH